MHERGFVQQRDAQLLGLRELGSGILTDEHIARLLRHAARDLPTACSDLAFGRFTGELLEAAGEYEGPRGPPPRARGWAQGAAGARSGGGRPPRGPAPQGCPPPRAASRRGPGWWA